MITAAKMKLNIAYTDHFITIYSRENELEDDPADFFSFLGKT
jgi:hypothetical protein